VDAAEVARIVADDHALALTDPGAHHVGPIADRVQENAFTANEAALHRQEVNQEAARIGDGGWRAASRRLAVAQDSAQPSRERRRADAAMQIAMIPAQPCAVLEPDRQRLRRDRRTSVEEAHQQHEVSFERALVLDRLSVKRPEFCDVRTPTERDASHRSLRLTIVRGESTPRCWGQSTI
jgi:hypothetical protein